MRSLPALLLVAALAAPAASQLRTRAAPLGPRSALPLALPAASLAPVSPLAPLRALPDDPLPRSLRALDRAPLRKAGPRAASALSTAFDRTRTRGRAAAAVGGAPALARPERGDPQPIGYNDRAMSPDWGEYRTFDRGRLGELLYSEERPDVLVKRFEPRYAGEGVAAWAEIARALSTWVASDPRLAERVEVRVPLEVGRDYLVRPLVSLGSPVTDFANPSEAHRRVLRETARAVREAAPESGQDRTRAGILRRVARRSLESGHDNLFWDAEARRLVLAEPRIAPSDLEDWARAE